MITLGDLLAGMPEAKSLSKAELALPITGVTSDSREVKPGFAFVAIRGTGADGHHFIPKAQQAGAAVAIGEEELPAGALPPYVRVGDSRLALARLASTFHGNPSHRMLVVGVTGTSGKTTTTYLIESILRADDQKVGVIGTVNVRFGGKELPASHTTPGAVELHRTLAEMRDAGCTAAVMEVSSHALKQHRVAFVAFDAMVFTNLSPEHLDYHPDMEDYFRSKSILFNECVEHSIEAWKRPFAAINGDDEFGRRLVAEIQDKAVPTLRYGRFGLGADADFSGAGLRIGLSGIDGTVDGAPVRSSLAGRFNAYNILAAIAVARGLGIDGEAISSGLSTLKTVPGRLERVPNERGIHVIVDYAHKPDALEKVLRALGEGKGSHRLITVFGCGGDRDRTKRPVMGKLAVELSDRVVITSDNPRTEDPGAIIAEIVKGVDGHANYKVEPDRRKAILAAIGEAKAGDVVLIAGKGHEDYQIIGKEKIHFDDREVAAEACLTRVSEKF